MCYRCSYTTETEGSRRDCIENPSALGFGSHLECNSTSYCVLQEQYDIRKLPGNDVSLFTITILIQCGHPICVRPLSGIILLSVPGHRYGRVIPRLADNCVFLL